MIGENELTLNHATVARAVEEYLKTVSAIGHGPKVLEVKQVEESQGSYRSTDAKDRRFKVSIHNEVPGAPELTP